MEIYDEILERGCSVSPSGVVLDQSGNEYRTETGECVFVDVDDWNIYLMRYGTNAERGQP